MDNEAPQLKIPCKEKACTLPYNVRNPSLTVHVQLKCQQNTVLCSGMCNSVTFLSWITKSSVTLSPCLMSCQSDINAVGPGKMGHVGCQGRVGGQDFDRQIPAECIHINVLCPRPYGDLCLVLKNCGRFHWLPGCDEFKVQAPPQDHCAGRELETLIWHIV